MVFVESLHLVEVDVWVVVVFLEVDKASFEVSLGSSLGVGVVFYGVEVVAVFELKSVAFVVQVGEGVVPPPLMTLS